MGISTMTDLPACIILALIQVRYDRTKTMLGFLLISGFATSFMTYLKYSEINQQTNDQDNSNACDTDINNSTFNNTESLIFVLMIVFRFGIMSIWNFFCTYTNELFPTAIRSTCCGIPLAAAATGMMVSPYVFALGAIYFDGWFPMAFCTGTLLFSIFLLQILPETRNHQLLQSFREAEELYNA